MEFHVDAVSRVAPIPNPIVRLGFYLLREHERRAFLESTKRRMLAFTELALSREHAGEPIRDAAANMTARPTRGHDAAHDSVAGSAGRG